MNWPRRPRTTAGRLLMARHPALTAPGQPEQHASRARAGRVLRLATDTTRPDPLWPGNDKWVFERLNCKVRIQHRYRPTRSLEVVYTAPKVIDLTYKRFLVNEAT